MATTEYLRYACEDGTEFLFPAPCGADPYIPDGIIITSDMNVYHPEFLTALQSALNLYPDVYALAWVEECGELAARGESGIRSEYVARAKSALDSGRLEASEKTRDLVNLLYRIESKKQEHLKRMPPESITRAGYVYLVKADNGYYKIGRTVDPSDRIRTFGIKLPFRVEYEHVIKTDDMVGLERGLHEQFADKRADGEWFALSDEDVRYIKLLGGD